MELWIRYPLTAAGYKALKCPSYVRVVEIKRHKGWMVVMPERNAVGFTSKSLYYKEVRSYGHGLLMENGTLAERRDWYKRQRPSLPRKIKKKLIGTKRRKA